MTPSNANTSGLAPTEALRLDEAQRTAIEHAAMDANADVWRHCRLAMVADGEIVGYPCFSRADMAELARLYEAAPASPLPGGGDWINGQPDVPVGSPAWCAWATHEIMNLRAKLPAAPIGEPK